ncbi:MAG: rhomboid family intramembrane serine protease [Deinococcales bacterium]
MFPLRDDNPKHRPSFVMWSLLAINVLVFALQILQSSDTALAFVNQYALIPRLFFREPAAQAFDLISYMFFHGSIAHIAGNMFFLWVFADNIEDRLGHSLFLVFYLAGGVVAALCHALLDKASNIPMVGASGAISAVLGAYFVFFPRHRVQTLIPPFFLVWLPAWVYLGIWAIMQVFEAFSGLVGSNVAWWAHIGGFVFGLVVALVIQPFLPKHEGYAYNQG